MISISLSVNSMNVVHKLIKYKRRVSVLQKERGLDEWVDVCALFYTVNLADACRGWCVAMVI